MKDPSAPGANHVHGLSEALVPGARVGGARYILRRVLGRGGMTAVWLARDVKLEQEVALKLLPAALLQDLNAVERLKNETRRNLQLAHPQIARTYDFIQDHQLAAIAMEYVDGWSLAAMRVDRARQRYRLEEVTPWVRQLCAALTYAHTETGILHLALKPANLMLNSREQLKLTDFGIARSLQGIAAPRDLNVAAAAVGFMSPQQALGQKPSVLDDVYGLGATIYDLLTGTPPFYKGQVLAQVCDLKPSGMTERLFELAIEDSIPLVVEDTVALCLEKDPAKRPQSISQVLQLLERSEVPLPVSAPKPLVMAPQPVEPQIPSPPISGPPTVVAPPVESPPKVAEPTEAPPLVKARPSANRRTFIMAGLVAGAALGLLALTGVGFWFWAANHAGKGWAATAGSAGSLDTTFRPATNADQEIRVALQQPDGRILIGGMFTEFGDGPCRGIARLETDGSLDGSLGATVQGDVFALALQQDGKIILGGSFTEANGQPCRRIARISPDGTLDESFTAKAGVNHEVRTLVVQPDGKILAGGHFDAVSGHRQNHVARFNADGTRDGTFNPGRGAAGIVWSLALQADAKILVAGDFTSFDQKPWGRLVRLNPSGRADTSFAPGSGADAQIFAVAVQPDGKIVIGGDFTRFNLVERNRIARLNPDGSLDNTFTPGAGPNTGIRCLSLQPDGKLLIGGVFTSVNGVARGRVARLNADGSLDMGFNPGEGASEVVRWVAPQADGKVVVVGGFSRFDGKDCVRLARLRGGSR